MSRLPREIEVVRAIHDKILQKSMQLIAKHGFQSLTMRMLAHESGMTAANIYNYFSGKDEIFLRIVISGYGLLAAELDAAMNRTADPYAKAREMMLAFVRFGLTRWDHYQLMFVVPAPHYADFKDTSLESLAAEERRHSLQVLATVYAVLENLTGDFMSETERKILVTEVWSMLHGWITLYHRGILSYITAEPEKYVEPLVDDFIARFRK